MKAELIHKNFSIFLMDPDFGSAGPLAEKLKARAYNLSYFPTPGSAMSALKESPPHILILNYSVAEAFADSFINDVKAFSPETLIVLLVHGKHLLLALQKVASERVWDFLQIPMLSELELTQKLDRAIVKLYLVYENEQIRRAKNLSPQEHLVKPNTNSMEFGKDELLSFGELMNELEAQSEHQGLADTYLKCIGHFAGDTPRLYLAYIPSLSALQVKSCVGLDATRLSRVGIPLRLDTSEKMRAFIEDPSRHEALSSFVAKAFNLDKFVALPLAVNDKLRGLSLLLTEPSSLPKLSLLVLLHRFYCICHERNEKLELAHNSQLQDEVTGLLAPKHFYRRLEEEVSRSRRIRHPISLIRLQLSQSHELEERFGDLAMRRLLKAFGKMLLKNFRCIDVLARLGPNDFAFLLPHTGAIPAALRAEKIRNHLAGQEFSFSRNAEKFQLNFSAGVSEYPSLCLGGETLLSTSQEALDQSLRAGGNRVAVWQVGRQFTPDYIVQIDKLSS